MSTSETMLICGACGEQVSRSAMTCPRCNCSLSSSQLKASALREMTPSGFRELAEAYLLRLRKKPVADPLTKAICAEGDRFVAEFRRWEEGLLPDVELRLQRLGAYSTWCSRIAAEIRRRP